MEQNKVNSFLEKEYSKKLPFGWYLLGSIAVIFFSFVGQIPIFFFISEDTSTTVNPNSLMDMFAHLDKNLFLFLILIPFFIAFLGFWIVIKFIHKQSLKSVTTSRSKIDYKRFFFGFGFWSLITILITVIDFQVFPKDYEVTFRLKPFLIMSLILLPLIPIQSGLEEYLFRGYLMQGFAKLAKNRWFPLLLTSFIFGTLHIFNPEVRELGMGIMIYYIATGLFFGIMTLMDEGIELALGFHIANNLITALLVTADWTAFQTESILKDISEPTLLPELLLTLLILYPFSLAVLSKKYNWSNWKYKLTAKIDEKT